MATVNEYSVVPGQPYLKALFAPVPADSRFAKCEYIPCAPTTHIDPSTRQITFVLLPKDPPYVYLLNDMLLYCTTVITNEDKTSLPANTAVVAPICNGPASLFSDLRMSINDKLITTNQSFYPYKCYFTNLLSYPETAKATNLHLSGWSTDTAYADAKTEEMTTHADMQNLGLVERNQWYRTQYGAMPAKYRSQGYTFLAPFKHDLNGVNKPLPPGFQLTFVLDRAPHEFSLMRVAKTSEHQAKADIENYQIIITECRLYVKVAQMNLPLYRELQAKIEHEPILYHHRRLFVHFHSFQFNSHMFQTNNLFPGI